MGELTKLTIEAFSDEKYTKATGKRFTAQVNPTAISHQKKIALDQVKAVNVQHQSPSYLSHAPESVSFDILLDSTGAVPGSKDIPSELMLLEQVVYNINGEIHQPNFLVISWGALVFKGMLTTLSYQFTLFSPDGKPLRVKVSMAFTAVMDPTEAAKRANMQSPDLSKVIELKAGDTIAAHCDAVYGDASYCVDVAAANALPSFRHVSVGKKVMFPPLIR